MASPAPKSPEQSERNRKYDRQLRLWGDHGQATLEGAHVCVINATGLGTEILKSLVLSGIGAFTIVDGKKVTNEDVGANFFLEADSVGKSRAQVSTQMLLELNSDVRGDYIDEEPEQILYNSPDFFNNFTVVVATSLTEKSLILLSQKLWELNIPLIVCRSIGFIAYMRIQVKEHTVIETHPDNEIPDLRLDKPFETLKKHIDSINLDDLSFKDHSHVPYLVILYKFLERWLLNKRELPKTYKEKYQLKQMIEEGMRRDDNDTKNSEENFEEAIKAVNTCIGYTEIPDNVMNILNDNQCINLTAKSSSFWIIAKAVRDFVENEGAGLLPLKGTLPDMTADTEKYIALQQIYHKQATADVEAVWRRTLQLLRQLGKSSDYISERDVKLFCRHILNIHVERGTCIADEYDSKIFDASNIDTSVKQETKKEVTMGIKEDNLTQFQQKSSDTKFRRTAPTSSAKNNAFDTSIPVIKLRKNICQTFPRRSPCRKIQNINIVFPPDPRIELRMSQSVLEKTFIFEANSKGEKKRSIDSITIEKHNADLALPRSTSMVRDIVKKMEACKKHVRIPQKEVQIEAKCSTIGGKRSNFYKKNCNFLTEQRKNQSSYSKFLNSQQKSMELQNVVQSKQPQHERSLVRGIIETLMEKMRKSLPPRENQDFGINQNFVKQLVRALEKEDTTEVENSLPERTSVSEEGSFSESETKSNFTSTSLEDTDSNCDSDLGSLSPRNDDDQKFTYCNSVTKKMDIEQKILHDDDSVYWIPVSKCELPRSSTLLSMMSRLSSNAQSPCMSPVRSESEVDDEQPTSWGTSFKKTNDISKKLFRIDETVITDSGYSDRSDRSEGSPVNSAFARSKRSCRR